MKGKVKLLICDDHAGYRRLLEAVFSNHPNIEVAGEAAGGNEAVQKCIELHPNVVVMDLNMEGCGGLAATEQIHKSGSATKVLIHSGQAGLEDVAKCMRAGASGYLPKGCPITELYEAVLSLAEGETYLASGTTQPLALTTS